jgi:hypothetical protein
LSSNILEYRPELEYVLKDINTIDNVNSKVAERVEPYIVNNTSSVINKISEIKESVEGIRTSIDDKLKDFSVKTSIQLDDVSKQRILALTDGSKFVSDGTITYQLYKEAKDDPLLSVIVGAWDEYNAGINGSVEAELAPYVNEVGELIDGLAYLIENTILYEKSQDVLSDPIKFKESELDEINRYVKLREQYVAAINAGSQNTVTIKKQLDSAELKLEFKKNLVLTIKTSLLKISNIVQNLNDVTVPEFHRIQQQVLAQELATLGNNVSIDSLGMRAIVYSTFAKQYSDVLSSRRSHENLFTSLQTSSAFKAAVVDSRLYKDVAIKAIAELTYADSNLEIKTVGNTVISGLEIMTKSYENSILGVKNTLESSIITMGALINSIYEKYKTRVMYKSVN